MPASLEFKAFKSSPSKVKLLSFHPTQPWLAYADRGSDLTVLNWETQQVVYEAPVGFAEDLNAVEAALQRQAERDLDYFGTPNASTDGFTKSPAAGSIRDMCFMDMDTCFWQIAHLQSLQHNVHSSSSLPYIGLARRLRGHRWLVIACDTKILMQDLASSSIREIPRSVLDSKAPTCLAILYIVASRMLTGSSSSTEKEENIVCPVIAAGTSTGMICLLSTTHNVCYARLVGGHKAAVTKLLVVGGKEPGSPDALVSAAADGTIAYWQPSMSAAGAAGKEINPIATVKPHDAEITSLILSKSSPSSLGQTSAPVHLVSSGVDKKVVMLSLPTLHESTSRWKPLPKGSVDAMATCSYSPENQILAISGDRATVWSLPANGRQQSASSLLVLDNFLPLGTKKAAKVYIIACHPLLPHVVAIGANAGVGLLTFSRHAQVPAAVIPLPLPSAEDIASPKFSGAPSHTLEYLFASGSELIKLSYRADRSLTGMGAVPLSRDSIASTSGRGGADVAVSPDGRHCSVTWQDSREYAVYTSSARGVWQQVQVGHGSSVVWASNASTFAVLRHPEVHLPEARRGKTKKSKAKEEENAQQAAIYAANMAAQSGSQVRIFSLTEDGRLTEHLTSVPLQGETPHKLFGGPVLSISTKKIISRGHVRGHKMQFHSWKTGAAVGPELLTPNWLAWDPAVTACALAYADAVVICRAQPSFAPVITLPLQAATDGIWQRKLLFVASPSAIHAVFVAADREKASPFIETVKLASLDGGVISQTTGAGDSGAALPTESMRCPGPVAIAGIREGILWLIDAQGSPFMISLSHPGIRARAAAAQGDAESAAAIVESSLAKGQHSKLAQFIAAMIPGKGLEAGLSLSGIGLQEELVLSRRSCKFRRALRCLQALAAGADSSAAFQELPAWGHHLSEAHPLEMPAALPGPNAFLSIQHLIQHTRAKSMDLPKEVPEEAPPQRSVLHFIAADNADDETSEDSEAEQQAEAMMGLALAPADAIDWDGPLATGTLQEEEEATDEEAEPDANGHVPDANGLPGLEPDAEAKREAVETEAPVQEQQRIARLAKQGLALVDAALGYGQEDVGVAALRTLLRGVAFLEAEDLQAVLLRCVQCNMGGEVSSVAARTVANGTGASPETAALVAALVDDSNLARKALHSSGLVALSAIYSHTWKTGNSLQDINDWGNFLTAAAGNGIQFAVAPPT